MAVPFQDALSAEMAEAAIDVPEAARGKTEKELRTAAAALYGKCEQLIHDRRFHLNQVAEMGTAQYGPAPGPTPSPSASASLFTSPSSSPRSLPCPTPSLPC